MPQENEQPDRTNYNHIAARSFECAAAGRGGSYLGTQIKRPCPTGAVDHLYIFHAAAATGIFFSAILYRYEPFSPAGGADSGCTAVGAYRMAAANSHGSTFK